MTCKEVVDFLLAYQSNELDAAERVAFEAHIADCPDCVSYIRSYEEAVKLGKAACEDEKLAQVPEELVQAILAARRRVS